MLFSVVSLLEWVVLEGKGKVYVYCIVGFGRVFVIAIVYMFWFGGMNVSYEFFYMFFFLFE